jgi:hypothetical protein
LYFWFCLNEFFSFKKKIYWGAHGIEVGIPIGPDLYDMIYLFPFYVHY